MAIPTLSDIERSGQSAFASGGGGGASITAVTITVPWSRGGGLLDWTQTVAVAGLVSTSRLGISLMALPDVDDNDVEELDRALFSAAYASDGFAVISASFSSPVTGAINLSLMVI